MKQIKLTALRKVALLFIAIMLVSCLTIAFVACNNNEDGSSDSDFSISLSTIDSVTLNQALTGGMGYIYAHKEDYSTCYLDCNYSSEGTNNLLNRSNAQNISIILTLSISLFNYDETDEANNKVFACQLMFFESEQKANDNFDNLKNYYGDSAILTKNGKVIIMESSVNVYDTIKKSTIAENSVESEQLKFYKTALQNELNNKNSTVSASYSANDNGCFYLVTSPIKGNVVNRYIYGSTEFLNELDSLNILEENYLDNYSSDSYIKESNGTYYFYASPNLGFHFAKNSDDTAYVVTDYYYEEIPNSLIIPATYNEKPVVEIANINIPKETESITIPSSIKKLNAESFESENLTTINFQGTKEQWEELGVELGGLKINCTDDDKTGDNDDTSGINVEILWNKIIGFVLSAQSPTECGFDFYNNGNDVEDMFGTNSTGYMYAVNTEHIVYIAFYDTDEHAQENISFVETAWNDLDLGQQFVVKQEKNALIIDGNGESYNALMDSTIPDNVLPDRALEFITDNIPLSLPENLNRAYGGLGYGLYVTENGYIFSSAQIPANSTFSTEYIFYTNEAYFYDTYPSDIINQIGTKYTEDSYITFNEDGIYACLIENPNYTKS